MGTSNDGVGCLGCGLPCAFALPLFFECALNRVFLPVVAFFCFLSGGMAFWLLFRLVCGFKWVGACLLFYLGSFAFCCLVAVSQFVFEVAWVRDGLVKVDAP